MEISEITKKYWEEKDWQDVDSSASINDLYAVAQRIIGRMPKPFVQVCGPITTGGLGDRDANLKEFNRVIQELQKKGLNVFDQMPFEDAIGRIAKDLREQGLYNNDVLEYFYLPLFNLKHIATFYFMPDWQSSIGAKWEHEKAKELGAEIVYL